MLQLRDAGFNDRPMLKAIDLFFCFPAPAVSRPALFKITLLLCALRSLDRFILLMEKSREALIDPSKAKMGVAALKAMESSFTTPSFMAAYRSRFSMI